MRKVLLTLLLSLITLLPLKADVKSIIDSVAYLQAGEGHCTAWSIGVKQWITEGHCVDEEPLVINGEEARVVKLDDDGAIALPLADPADTSFAMVQAPFEPAAVAAESALTAESP